MNTFMSIDPGVSGTGVAVWELNDYEEEKELPIKTYSFFYKTKNEYMDKLDLIIFTHNIKECICENAAYFQGDVRGQVTATTGKLIKLAQFIGSIEEVCRRQNVKIDLIPVVKWKGQLPKHVTTRKVLEYLLDCPYNPKKPSHSHVFDAIALGMWKLGKF